MRYMKVTLNVHMGQVKTSNSFHDSSSISSFVTGVDLFREIGRGIIKRLSPGFTSPARCMKTANGKSAI